MEFLLAQAKINAFARRTKGKTLRSSITDEAVATYKFTGKELDDENDLNWYDFGARRYDP
jgi:hypothetical protein